MSLNSDEIIHLIKQTESRQIEFKSILPAFMAMAKLIAAFANSEGGYIIVGVNEKREIKGLHEDFQARTIVQKAIQVIAPTPKVEYDYIQTLGKTIFAIKVVQSSALLKIGENIYKRKGNSIVLESGEPFVNVVSTPPNSEELQPNAPKPLKSVLNALLADSKLEQVIKQLLEYGEHYDSNIHKIAIMQSARLTDIIRQETEGVIASSEVRLERNKITAALVRVIDSLS